MTSLLKSGLWIQGHESAAETGDTFPVFDPGRGEVFGTAARGQRTDVDRAVGVARQAFYGGEWRSLSPHQRGRLLWKWACIIEKEKDKLARMATQVGFPPGVINVVTGLGEEAGAALAGHPGIQALAFCGSVATGRQVLVSAAACITPVLSLELGGKSPCLVFEDADVDKAAASVAWGICYNTGQSCGALSRLLVPENLYGEILEKVSRTMASIRLGYGLDDPDMGPLVSKEQLERVLGYV